MSAQYVWKEKQIYYYHVHIAFVINVLKNGTHMHKNHKLLHKHLYIFVGMKVMIPALFVGLN